MQAVINYKLVDEERGGHSIAEWFGGYQKEAGVKQKNVKSKLRCLVSAALKSLYIILQIPADTNGTHFEPEVMNCLLKCLFHASFFLAENVAKLQSFLTEFNCHTAKDLIDLILEDDEDLNYLLLCCLEINRFACRSVTLIDLISAVIVVLRRVPKSCGDLLNVNYLWMELQINIGWDHSLILDWINSSETEFLLFLVRYLKLLIHTKEDFKTVKLTPWLNNDTGIERGKQLQNGKLLLEVTIHENLAGLNSCKTIKMYVNGEVNRQTSVIKKLNDSGEMAHQKMSKLFGELSGALVKLQSRKLLNFNPGPLVKLLKSYGDISSN